jgi:hypothetical protein
MKCRAVTLILFLAASAAFPLLPSAHSDPPTVEGPEPAGQPIVAGAPQVVGLGNRFDPVFAIMNRSPSQMGCLGCHVSPRAQQDIPWFGKDQASVLQTLETGITPDGNQLSVIPVEGGRSGILGRYLHNGTMPLNGTPWTDAQLEVLDRWLITYED